MHIIDEKIDTLKETSYDKENDYDLVLEEVKFVYNDYKDYYEKIEIIEIVKDEDYLYGVKVNGDYISFDY